MNNYSDEVVPLSRSRQQRLQKLIIKTEMGTHTSAAKQVQSKSVPLFYRENKVNVLFSFSDSTDLICVT